jgi:hypothetical protein
MVYNAECLFVDDGSDVKMSQYGDGEARPSVASGPDLLPGHWIYKVSVLPKLFEQDEHHRRHDLLPMSPARKPVKRRD